MENSWVLCFLLLALFSRCLTFLTIQLCQDFLILLSPDLLCNTVTVRDTISKMLDLNQVAIHIICTYLLGQRSKQQFWTLHVVKYKLLTYYKTQLLHGRYRFLKDCFDSDCRLDPHPIGVLGPVLSRIVKKRLNTEYIRLLGNVWIQNSEYIWFLRNVKIPNTEHTIFGKWSITEYRIVLFIFRCYYSNI